jgi:hypothetical protein
VLGGLSYGFLREFIPGGSESVVAEVTEDQTPTLQQVLDGKTALERWKATPKEQRVPLAKSIVYGKVLLNMPQSYILKALGEPKPDACEEKGHMHYVMIETDQTDVDLIVEIDNDTVTAVNVKKWLW